MPTLLCLLAFQAAPVEIADGDRIALIGNTFAERDLQHNRLEALLVSRLKDRRFQFRNLGWSGDTVFGHARAGFGSVEDGFKHLSKHLDELKPTIALLAYGLNESFEGEPGLPEFRKGLARLLDRVAAAGARPVLLSPVRHENLDPAHKRNRDLALYVDALRQAALERKAPFVDLFELKSPTPMTDNGIHLNDHGYRLAAETVARALGVGPKPWRIEIDGGAARAEGVRVTDLQAGIRFQALDDHLPAAPRELVVKGLAPGRWALKGRASATAEDWAKGVALSRGPEFEQAEALRALIAEKNLLYFNYWRPQNDTYIFGFRKREQGHLQPEMPQFLPLIAQKEDALAKLRLPVPQTYVLEPEK